VKEEDFLLITNRTFSSVSHFESVEAREENFSQRGLDHKGL
jgi:hypothetical protein